MFNIEDWDMEVIEDTVLSGDFVYWSYVDGDRFREDNMEWLLVAAGVHLPFGE